MTSTLKIICEHFWRSFFLKFPFKIPTYLTSVIESLIYSSWKKIEPSLLGNSILMGSLVCQKSSVELFQLDTSHRTQSEKASLFSVVSYVLNKFELDFYLLRANKSRVICWLLSSPRARSTREQRNPGILFMFTLSTSVLKILHNKAFFGGLMPISMRNEGWEPIPALF